MYRRLVFIIILCLIVLSHTFVNAEENAYLTRAELASVTMDTYEYITQTFSFPTFERPIYNDISNTPFAFRIEQATALHFMNGVGNEEFAPNNNVTKCELAVVIYRLVQCFDEKYDVSLKTNRYAIHDIDNVPEWAVKPVEFVVSTDILTLDEGSFNPYSLVTEDEMKVVIEKLKSLYVTTDDIERIDLQMYLDRITRQGDGSVVLTSDR